MDFHGKVALITGGGNGIGRAAAIGFASRGAKVVVVDRDQAAGEATAGIVRQQGGDALFVAADVTKSADVQNYVKLALDQYGAIDCFHNNAGIEGSVAPTHQYDEEMFDRVMAVNVKGVFLGLRHVLPVMIKQGQRLGGQHRLGRRPRRLAGNARLCRLQARRHRPDQDRGRRGGARPACGSMRSAPGRSIPA